MKSDSRVPQTNWEKMSWPYEVVPRRARARDRARAGRGRARAVGSDQPGHDRQDGEHREQDHAGQGFAAGPHGAPKGPEGTEATSAGVDLVVRRPRAGRCGRPSAGRETLRTRGSGTAVGRVYDDYGDEDRHRDEKEQSLHKRVVLVEHRLQQHVANSRVGKDVLDEDRR